MLAENFDVGADVEYSCDEGHLLVGPTIRTCLDTGFYNEFPPVCKRIQCGYPADIANGEYTLVNDSVGYLSRVMYKCDDGYKMIGRAQLACDIDERWNGPPPRCEAVECAPPPQIENGIISNFNNETVYGSEMEYACKPGYKLIGPNKLLCMANGQYDNAPPKCQEENVPTSVTPILITKPAKPSPTTVRSRTRPTRPVPTTIKADTDIVKITERGRRPPSMRVTTENHPSTIIIAGHPQDNEIAGSSNVQQGEAPNVNVPLSIDGDRRDTYGAKLNLGAIIALGAFGGFIFLAAIITTIVVLVRRNRSAKHYRHRASPDCNTVASFDSSSSESRNGLNRYYRQAWENLHESAGSKTGLKVAPGNHSPLKRKETMDEPFRNGERHREGSELVVSDTAAFNGKEKKRHHHHHHHHDVRPHKEGREWREPRPPPHREQKRY